MLDVISGGRLVAGFPVGTPFDTCFAYGQNPSQLRARYYEAHDLMLALLEEPAEMFRFNGSYNDQLATSTPGRDRSRIRIRRYGSPAAAPSRPGTGAPRWTTSTAYLTTSATRGARRSWSGFWDKMRQLGMDRNPYRAGFLQFVGVAETRTRRCALP